MSSLFGMTSKYKSQLTLLPVTILIFVVLSMILFILFRRDRLMKYVPALAGIFLGLILLIFGFLNITEPSGLEWVWRGVAVFVAGCISLATAWLLSIFSSFISPYPEEENRKKSARKKIHPSNKGSIPPIGKSKPIKKISRKKTTEGKDDWDQTKIIRTRKGK